MDCDNITGIETSETTSQIRTINKKIFKEYTYEEGDVGPFRIVFEREDDKPIYKVQVGQTIKKLSIFASVMDIKKTGLKKVTVYFSSMVEANQILNNQEIKQLHYKTYIPEYFISIKGVITGIPVEMSIEEIEEEISDNNIINMYRMTRFSNGKKIPSDRIVISWRAKMLPKYVKLCYVRSRVDMFIRKTIICENCLRFNHLAANCKGKKQCSNCGDKKCEFLVKEKLCEKEEFCRYCRMNHKTTDRIKCNEWNQQKNIKMIMATRPISYQEAKNEIDFFMENRFNILSVVEDTPRVYETFAQIQRPNNKNHQKTELSKKTQKEVDSEAKENVEIGQKRKRADEEEELLGIGLNNKYKVSDIEKLKSENEKKIREIERNHHTFLMNIMQKLNNKEKLSDILFELERNIHFEHIAIPI